MGGEQVWTEEEEQYTTDMKDTTQTFYDELSSDYHLIFADWNRAIQRQANTLDTIIREYTKLPCKNLLDCSCWIGTQSIWLAQKWYNITASDLSPKAIERGKKEAELRDLNIAFQVADFKKLDTQVEGTFDTIISCDNSLPHILEDENLNLAAKNIYSKLNENWLLLASIRDYDDLLEDKPVSTMPTIKEEGTISFQTWDWEENNVYTVNHFTLKKDEKYKTHHRSTKYRAYKREELTAIFERAWFKSIKWLMPEQSKYYQPIVSAYK